MSVEAKVTVDLVMPPTTAEEVPLTTKRTYHRLTSLSDSGFSQPTEEVDKSIATLVSSKIDGKPGLHAPAIDLDIPAALVPSSTPGHSHLYIDAEIPLDDYLDLLRVMVRCGLVEPGFYQAARKRKQTMLRRPGIKKISQEEYAAQEEALAIACILRGDPMPEPVVTASSQGDPLF
jgi:hypothetical protein